MYSVLTIWKVNAVTSFVTLAPIIKKEPYMRKGIFNITSSYKDVSAHTGTHISS